MNKTIITISSSSLFILMMLSALSCAAFLYLFFSVRQRAYSIAKSLDSYFCMNNEPFKEEKDHPYPNYHQMYPDIAILSMVISTAICYDFFNGFSQLGSFVLIILSFIVHFLLLFLIRYSAEKVFNKSNAIALFNTIKSGASYIAGWLVSEHEPEKKKRRRRRNRESVSTEQDYVEDQLKEMIIKKFLSDRGSSPIIHNINKSFSDSIQSGDKGHFSIKENSINNFDTNKECCNHSDGTHERDCEIKDQHSQNDSRKDEDNIWENSEKYGEEISDNDVISDRIEEVYQGGFESSVNDISNGEASHFSSNILNDSDNTTTDEPIH